MLGGDSSSSQQWGMEEDEVVFLKQVTPCPISSLHREAESVVLGASAHLPQIETSVLRGAEVSKIESDLFKNKIEKNWRKGFLGRQKGNDLGRSSWLPEPCLDPATLASCWPWRPG